MRRMTLVFLLVLVSLLASSAVSPLATTTTHAQTPPLNPSVFVSPSTVATGGTATVSGFGFSPSSWAFVWWQRPDGTNNSAWTFTSLTGSFSFTLGFSPSHGTGLEYVYGYDWTSNRWSAPFTVTVKSPNQAQPTLSAQPNPVTVGGLANILGTGFSPHMNVQVQWRRPDGTFNSIIIQADAAGSFRFLLGFLRSHGCGNETLNAYNPLAASIGPLATYTIIVTGC